jgi:hypothetical protein
MNFFAPKSIKIRWYSSLFESFAHHFQIKLSTHGSNPNSIFVGINELKFFLLMKVLILNSNIVEFVKKIGKNQRLYIQIIAVTSKMTSCRTMSKKCKNPRFYG